MMTDERNEPRDAHAAREVYETPVLRRFGAAAEVTRRVSMTGLPDGGPGAGGMSRTG
jgi:hypothetical protein